jgi:phage anti-repressor protein
MSFSDFLLKYTTINTRFIQDYSHIFNENYNPNNIIINSEILRKWLKLSQKQKYETFIKNNYRLNIDYNINKNNTYEHGGHNKNIITITPNTAKHICMVSRSPVAKEVRQYFIEIEGALMKYQEHIISSMQQKITQLENNQKPKVNAKSGIIYVFRALDAHDESVYKIGKTVSSKKRFSNYNSGLADDLEVLMTYESDNVTQLESCVKALMKNAQYRKYKEIYQVDLNILRNAIENCDQSIKEINGAIEKRKKGGGRIITDTDKLFMLIPKIEK